MNRQEYIQFLINMELKGINKDSKDENAYDDFCKRGIKEAFRGFSKDERSFIASFLKKYPHIYSL